MPNPSSFRDSTEIVLPEEVAREVQPELESQFTVSVHGSDGRVRVIGSPDEIKSVNQFLVRNGVTTR